WPNVESAFFKDLRKLHDKCGPWHILFFSGDLVQKGASKEYAKLTTTLQRVYAHLNALGSNPVLVAIPGNHDLERPDNTDDALAQLQRWHSDASLQDEFWNRPNSSVRKLIKRAFRNFANWNRDHPFPKPHIFSLGELPGDVAATVEIENLKIGILGLNT